MILVALMTGSVDGGFSSFQVLYAIAWDERSVQYEHPDGCENNKEQHWLTTTGLGQLGTHARHN